MRKFLVLLSFLIAIAGCRSTDKKDPVGRVVDPEKAYFDYQVWGDDEREVITIRAKYTNADREEPNYVIPGLTQLQFDGQSLDTGSTKWDGAYYELNLPREGFDGTHTIALTLGAGEKYTETFDFYTFKFRSPLPESIKRKELGLELDGLRPGEVVLVLLSDTAEYSTGVERFDTVQSGKITFSPEELEGLYNGPVRLDIIRDIETPIRRGGRVQGKIRSSYRIGKEFQLID